MNRGPMPSLPALTLPTECSHAPYRMLTHYRMLSRPLPLYMQASPLHLHSQESINMRITNGSSFHLTNSSLNISADQLSISQQESTSPLLSVNDGVVSIGPRVEVTDPLGVIIQGPLEANQVQSPANRNLQVQSLSGELWLTGGQGVRIEDGVGFDGVEVTSHGNLVVSSQTGQVREGTCPTAMSMCRLGSHMSHDRGREECPIQANVPDPTRPTLGEGRTECTSWSKPSNSQAYAYAMLCIPSLLSDCAGGTEWAVCGSARSAQGRAGRQWYWSV